MPRISRCFPAYKFLIHVFGANVVEIFHLILILFICLWPDTKSKV